LQQQDDKPEAKKDGDVEMKSEEPSSSAEPSSSTKHGDILAHQRLDLEFGGLTASPRLQNRRANRTSLRNCPIFLAGYACQLAHITFPADGRYQPVRAVSTRAPSSVKNGKATVVPAGSKSATAAIGLSSEKYAGGGGILILVDESPDQEAEFIEFESASCFAGTNRSCYEWPKRPCNRWAGGIWTSYCIG